ncbi:MAG: glycosyltransferase family 4 protein, partial [Bacteroidales bacterium]|nr:glycosyltransferase family 4 protein [Bacteroidales bacterium]
HDLNFFHEPQWVAKWPRWYYHKFFPKFIEKATRIATVSQFSKDDIADRFQYPKKQIDVVYNGANENYYPLTGGVKLETRKKYARGEDYFLFVGLVHPRKNLTRILKAFDAFKKKDNSKTKLIVVGSTAYWTDDTRLAYENSAFRDDILFVGRLEPEELHKVMGSALALVFTTLFEGFGIPILEAMYCNTPVITSSVTSMPEIGGEAVLYADPYSVDSIAEAMVKMAVDVEFRQKLVMKGEEQRLKFSWDNSANLVWKSIMDTIENATL